MPFDRSTSLCTGIFVHRLTVDGEVVGGGLLAHRVADATEVRAVVGAADQLEEQGLVAGREAEAAAWTEGLAVLHPQPSGDGAGGLAAQVGRAAAFYQDGFRAGDGGASYRSWQHTVRAEEKLHMIIMVMITVIILVYNWVRLCDSECLACSLYYCILAFTGARLEELRLRLTNIYTSKHI